MTSQDQKDWLKEVFRNCIENIEAKDNTYEKYFSLNYIQIVDGKKLNYKDFIAHMKVQKLVVQSIKVNFLEMICEDNKILSIHIADIFKKDGKFVKIKVMALFEIKDQKIIFCDELTHLLSGEESDKDLGSRY